MFVGLAIGRPRLCRTPRPPDASHAIPPRVLRLEASRSLRSGHPSTTGTLLALKFGVLPLHVGYLFETGYYKEPEASPTQDFPKICRKANI
jgi:hypothetical protein